MSDITHRGKTTAASTPGSFAPHSRSDAEVTMSATVDLSEMMEFDHVVTVASDGSVVDASTIYAPEVSASDEEPFVMGGDGWEVLRGFTGQYGYRGHVLHPSEYIGGALERHILENPGHYVAVEVRDEDGGFPDGDPIGWAVAYKPLEPEPAAPAESLVWVIEGDDHEVRLIEASSLDQALESAACEFRDQYGDYDEDVLHVAGAFRGDVDDPGSLEFVPQESIDNETYARRALRMAD